LSEFIIYSGRAESFDFDDGQRWVGLTEVEDVRSRIICSEFAESRYLEVYEAVVDLVVVLLFEAWDQPGKVWWGDHVPYSASFEVL
jgi:hypothetical protein